MKPYSILDNLIFLDIETTGIDSKNDKIVAISAVKIKDKLVTKFNTLVNPNRLVPLSIFILGREITQEDLAISPQINEVMKELLVFFEDLPLVCLNATFEENSLEISNAFLDLLDLFAILFPELTEFNFQYLLNKFIPHYKEENHTRLSDAENAVKLLNYAISKFYLENGYTLPMSITALEAWNWYPYLTKVNMGDVKGFLENKPIVFKHNADEPYPIFALRDYEKLFEHKDLWRRNGRSYTLRPQQRDAAKFIREGLEGGKITIMEAPTGLGKSLAYLLPASIYTYLKEEKIIISTNTKGLQNQLVDKDIPSLLETLNLKGDINYTLIKGKSNYLCFDRFKDIEYPKDMKTLIGYVYLKRLITEKGIGEVEGINHELKEKFNLNYLIEQCCCDSELCDVSSCKYEEQCYYASKVEALKEAQVIVINHSLLLKWPYKSIAPLENIVIDEAHNLTDEVYDAFESTLISYEFTRFLNDIYDITKKSGYLYFLSLRNKKNSLPLSEVALNMKQCNNSINNIEDAFENYIITSRISREYNIKEHVNKNNPNLSMVIKCLEYLKDGMTRLNINLDKSISILRDTSTIEKDKRFKILVEKVEVINSYINLLEDMVIQSKENYCFYFEVDKYFKWWKISSIPLDVSGAFYEKILSGAKSCLFVSATLSTEDSYNSFKKTLGINIAKSHNKEIVEVPPIKPIFNYKGKSAIYSIENIDPNNVEVFSEKLKNFVLELLHNVEGNIIMLFTSRKRLMAFKKAATEDLLSLKVRVVDGKKDIEKLKSRDERYILLGSKGYFEGIDIPGDTMTTVILDKVPNINGSEPFYKSLIDNMIERGKTYWQSYAQVNFPIVSIDLKQIYGRIIRTEYDYGSLFIMSKFHSDNSTVKKLATQLHGVPIIRKDGDDIFRDLKSRVTRWKQINLYKIMKEIKPYLKKSISEKKRFKEIESLKEIENFINEFMSFEYSKRNLKYDVNIYLAQEISIYINGKELKLDAGNSTKINQYFKDII
ncbi:MAG: ATP-dependent DNA helicase DinG [Clostridium sp.]|jgi:ATP-dependent DNA helicase DinG